jgi:hypothetical protein
MIPVYIIILLIHLLWTIWLSVTPGHTQPFNYYYNLSSGLFFLLPLIHSLHNLRKTATLGRSLPLWITTFASLTIAQLIWSYYNIFANIPAPFPGIGDIFWLLYYPCQFAILLSIDTGVKPKLSLGTISTFLFLALIFASYTTSFQFFTGNQAQPLLVNLLSFVYPFADALLAALSLTLLQQQRANGFRYLSFLTTAYLLTTVGDVLFAHSTSNQSYWNGNIVDFIFALAHFVLALAVFQLINHRTQNPVNQPLPAS